MICNSFLNLISPTSSTSHLHLRSISGAPGSRSVSMRALVRRQFRFLNESARAILTLERTFTGLEDFSGGKIVAESFDRKMKDLHGTLRVACGRCSE